MRRTPCSSLRAKRGNPERPRSPTGLLRRYAPRNDGRDSCRLLLAAVLLRIRRRRFTHPGALLPSVAAGLHPFLRDGAFAADDGVEFLPVDLAEIVMAALRVPAQRRIRHAQPERVGLRHGDVDEFLAELVIGLALDPPAHR